MPEGPRRALRVVMRGSVHESASRAHCAGSPNAHEIFLVGFSFSKLTTSASKFVAVSAATSALV